MVDELVKQLLEAGVHFGHQTRRWNPKMKRFIFGERSGIYIIDLQKTSEYLRAAQEFIKDIAAQGGKILFVGTKKQAQLIIEDEAKKAEMYFVKNRWLGGLLTNFQTVRKSIDKLNKIEQMKADGVWDNLKKKEVSTLSKERDKLLFNLGGIRDMNDLPSIVFIVDPRKEEIAIREARKLHIPIVAILDTNCDPDMVDYPIPGNDDALKSIRLITSLITKSILEGKNEFLTGKKSSVQGEGDEDSGAVEGSGTVEGSGAVEGSGTVEDSGAVEGSGTVEDSGAVESSDAVEEPAASVDQPKENSVEVETKDEPKPDDNASQPDAQ